MSEEAKCDCQHCGGHIAFPSEAAGQNVVCPHCGKETVVGSPSQQLPRFFVWQKEQQQGPFGQEIIQQMIADGQITDETLVCSEDGELDWMPAKDLFLRDSTPENLKPGYVAPAYEPPVIPVEPSTEIKINDHQSFFYQPTKDSDNAIVAIRLQSGAELKIKAVRLYDLETIQTIEMKKAQAAENMQGVSTGLGSIGSLGWVVASSLVIGAVEGVLSAGAMSQGAQLLSDAIKMESECRKSGGVFFPVGVISNVAFALPATWLVSGKKGDIETPKDQLRTASFVHNGDEFLTVQTADDVVQSIRWNAVESYTYQKPNAGV